MDHLDHYETKAQLKRSLKVIHERIHNRKEGKTLMELIWKILDEYIWGPGFFVGIGLAVYYAAKASELARENKKLRGVLRLLEDNRKAGGVD